MKQRTMNIVALMGTTLLHALLFYSLYAADIHPLHAASTEIVVTHITLLEDEKQTPAPKEPEKVVEPPQKEVVPPKPIEQPIVKKKEKPKKPQKAPKLVKKELMETIPQQESFSQPTKTPEPSEVSKLVAPNPPKATTSASHSGEQDALSRYLAQVRKRIQENLQYPTIAKRMGLEGMTTVQFVIASNGMIDKKTLKVFKSSGHKVLDNNALDAVLDAMPFDEPPQKNVSIMIPVVFKIKS